MTQMSTDIRHFMSLLEKSGELLCIPEEVDWKYEIGERTREIHSSQKNPPAILFEKIRNYPGHRVFTNGCGTYSRMALALGLDPSIPFQDLVEVIKKRAVSPVEPVVIHQKDMDQNLFKTVDTDLLKLPVPWWSRE